MRPAGASELDPDAVCFADTKPYKTYDFYAKHTILLCFCDLDVNTTFAFGIRAVEIGCDGLVVSATGGLVGREGGIEI